MKLAAVGGTESAIPTPAKAVPAGPQLQSFQDLLAAMSATAPSPLVVQRGDSLSRICADRIKELGGTATHRAIHDAVQQVARANHLTDPNKLYPGQKLDLSPVTGAAAPAATGTAAAKPWQALIEGNSTLSSSYGLRRDPFTGRVHQHTGIDVAAAQGAPVAAMAAGSVVYAGWRPGYGNTVVIRHADGVESLYGHLSKALVKVGDQVEAHMPIAKVGSGGRSTGAHLHFEVRKAGRTIDPLSQLG